MICIIIRQSLNVLLQQRWFEYDLCCLSSFCLSVNFHIFNFFYRTTDPFSTRAFTYGGNSIFLCITYCPLTIFHFWLLPKIYQTELPYSGVYNTHPLFSLKIDWKNVLLINYKQPENCFNGSHDFIPIHIYRRKIEITRIYTPETINVDINKLSKICLNGRHDFIHELIQNYASKNEIKRIYKSKTNNVDINTINA